MSDSTDTQPAADSSGQLSAASPDSAKIPTTIPAKNPNRVVAGKAVAERTRLAREAQK